MFHSAATHVRRKTQINLKLCHMQLNVRRECINMDACSLNVHYLMINSWEFYLIRRGPRMELFDRSM